MTPTITLSHGVVACIRCRGLSDPPSHVAIYHGRRSTQDTVELSAAAAATVNRYINVAEGGVAEVTYTIIDADAVRSGYYRCSANNSVAREEVDFKLLVDQQWEK